jgi:nucleotide-binding universal stress UspA family protein
MYVSLSRGVLVATDGSTSAARAETVAATIAAGCKCKLVILTISKGLPADELRRLAHSEGDLGAARRALVEQILEDAADRAKRAGVTEIQSLADHGDPATRIVSTAERESVDMIVVGKRGLGGLAQLLLGSVSRAVVDHAPCAVTVVP